MSKEEIFEKVNEIINILDSIPNQTFQDYLLMEINDCNYACEENWAEYLEEYGNTTDEEFE